MRLYLKNVGMIQEADIKLDGLTVIAGENDTGKSTVGKSLFAILKANLFVNNDKFNKKKLNDRIEWIFEKISKKQLLSKKSIIRLEDDNFLLKVDFENRNFISNKKFLDAIFIETPFIFNLYETLKAINSANSMIDFEIPYNYLWWDLFIKLSHKSKRNSKKDFDVIINKIEKVINGRFKKIEDISKDKWIFRRGKDEIEIDNVAMGIKQFGILYVLLTNRYLEKDRILIFDEPEVHLHPKWQIEYAKLIIELVKRDIKVLITSHSPYMIEALNIFSIKEKIKNNFYLAEGGFILEQDTIEKIFEKLVEPIKELKRFRIENI